MDNLYVETLSDVQKKFYAKITKSNKTFSGKSSRERIIKQYDSNGNYLNTYTSLLDAAKGAGIKQPSCISKVLNGKLRSAGGYLWKDESDSRQI
ncbi:MAG: NUMOD1 domain-containing DNA-binding protein [Dysgonomonas sp.]